MIQSRDCVLTDGLFLRVWTRVQFSMKHFLAAGSSHGLDYIWYKSHNLHMRWTVIPHDDFDDELALLAGDLQDEVLVHASLLAQFGPNLGRPAADTLKGSRHANMKELRFE